MKQTIKLSKRATTAIGCFWTAATLILIPLQLIFLTFKLAGVVLWSWWAILTPLFCAFGLPLAFVVIAVIVLAPKAVIEDRRRRKRVEAEAKKHGMERKPGESIEELKKRIVRRNMIAGNYSRKDIKDALLEAFPALASVQFDVNPMNYTIVMKVRKMPSNNNGWKPELFTDAELKEFVEFADQYVPYTYKITARNVDIEDVKGDDWKKLPYKVGDVVYVKFCGKITEAYITELRGKAKIYIEPDTYRDYDAEELYLTREDAEKALKGSAE